MEDLIYHNGIAVGCVERGHIVWFTNATKEAIAAISGKLSG
jgi:hypothetical protein